MSACMSFQQWYDRNVLPYALDLACGLPVISAQRRKVIPQAAGRVLEVGIGTGLNFAFYDRRKVTQLVGLDPAVQMHSLARRRSERAGLPIELHTIAAERIPFEASSFDCVVCTYTLCSVADPAAALAEMRRVLRPAGLLLFAEHGLAPDPAVARWQRRLEPYWGRIAGGCRLTREVPLLLREAGFESRLDCGYVAWPRMLSYNIWGVATVR
jgi:ubiquinone/menaquinone biosynthesis C-methylase UbiE